LYTNGGGWLKDAVPSDHHRPSTTSTELQRKYRVHQAWLDTYLSREEQLCLFQLSVFRGSFDVEAATAVILSSSQSALLQESQQAMSGDMPAGGGNADSKMKKDVAGLLELFWAVSILQRDMDTSSREARYSMHLLMRELAGDQLQSPQFEALRQEAQRVCDGLQLAVPMEVDAAASPNEIYSEWGFTAPNESLTTPIEDDQDSEWDELL
jgi:hypothetical protein